MLILLPALLLNHSYRKDAISGTAVASETRL